MTAINLKIIEPIDQKDYVGAEPVTFRGEVEVNGHPQQLEKVTLYFRWYSSLHPAQEDNYSINNKEPLIDPGAPFSPETPLSVGSHVITFAVNDQPKEDTAAMKAIQHGGVTGGAEGDAKCIIHVFKAYLIEPKVNDILDKNNTKLVAEAPLLWGKPKVKPLEEFKKNPEFIRNLDYEKINRLQYRWEFKPIGEPTTRETINFIPDGEDYVFEEYPKGSKIMALRFSGELPDELQGDYRLILHVEDIKHELRGHQVELAKCTVA